MPRFGTLGQLLRVPPCVPKYSRVRGVWGGPQICFWSGILIFLWVRSPWKNSETYENPFCGHLRFCLQPKGSAHTPLEPKTLLYLCTPVQLRFWHQFGFNLLTNHRRALSYLLCSDWFIRWLKVQAGYILVHVDCSLLTMVYSLDKGCGKREGRGRFRNGNICRS